MRIGLNLLSALPEIHGGWNYIANLLCAIGDYGGENSYVAYVSNASQPLVPDKANFRAIQVKIRAANRPQRVLYENTVLQVRARQDTLDCMHWFANTQALANAVPGAVTVYDLLAFQDSSRASVARRLFLRAMIDLTARRAAVLLPMSHATGQDIVQRFAIDPKRMVVIPALVGNQFAPVPMEQVDRFKSNYGLPDKFWLYVAHTHPHKNHLRLLEAYSMLRMGNADPWPLVLRGDAKAADHDLGKAISRLDMERCVLRLPRLAYSELPALYSAASALVFPSLFEGAGIPVIEAMACGCPVIASDIPPVREYAGEAASYFDPTDTSAIFEAMRVLRGSEDQAERNRRMGLERAKRFRAEAVAHKLLRAYSRLSSS